MSNREDADNPPLAEPARRRVLAGIDCGQDFAPVLQAAARLAATAHSELSVVYVVPPVPASTMAPYALNDLVDVEAGMLGDVVEALSDYAGEWSLSARHGDPVEQLLRSAREVNASVIVVGAQTPGWLRHLRRLTSRSVAEHLSLSQTYPVLVVPNGSHSPR